MAEVTIHPLTEAEEALAWYHDRSQQAAARFEAAFDEAIPYIASHPTMFPLCDPTHRYVMLRRFPYSLIYRLIGDSAHVVAVSHPKRRPRYWAGRE